MEHDSVFFNIEDTSSSEVYNDEFTKLLKLDDSNEETVDNNTSSKKKVSYLETPVPTPDHATDELTYGPK